MSQAVISSASTLPPRQGAMRRLARRNSTVAFLLTLPLILLILGLVVYPFLYALYLSMLNKRQTRFIGLDNFTFLFSRETFWNVVFQSVVFAVSAVLLKAIIGFVLAHVLHALPAKGQRKWRGMLLVPWVIPPAISTLAWWWLFDPSYSAFNWALAIVGVDPVPWLGATGWARFSVILVNVWYGAPFFMIMYLAALKSVPDQLYEAAAIDGASAWQKLRYVTFPMMRNIISITVLFSLIVTFANFDIVRILTNGGPQDSTHVFATYAFQIGIQSGDIPLGASVSLFMFPLLAVFAIFTLRGVNKRTKEMA
ncbi:carbohydrate ABC transporter permease [Pseudoroseomonas ludipueritiae]|uniref:Sugar ABC transporter permease n=1 Tax=Pseudoroseomonas ludipueritiae TaxID=198093 RepID=A0ABR7RCB0_9PROT|nr:sugar ABC transporter permease [Pseudoroseomonas ludipueritiae]MBC9179386.1 sugar ABC transporter permease [Pseudoroseomonas ludipueritiae]MCG7360647.1 sugar ABC transporter permease [Roseomonas sp. ACRSG]